MIGWRVTKWNGAAWSDSKKRDRMSRPSVRVAAPRIAKPARARGVEAAEVGDHHGLRNFAFSTRTAPGPACSTTTVTPEGSNRRTARANRSTRSTRSAIGPATAGAAGSAPSDRSWRIVRGRRGRAPPLVAMGDICYDAPVVILAYFVCALVWGTTWFAIRVCIGPGGYPPFLSAALRFTVAALILGAAMAFGLGKPRPRRRAAAWIALAGLLNAGGYALVYRAEQDIAGGIAAVLYGTMPLVTAAIAAITRTERPRASTIAGALVGLAGIAVIFWDRMTVSAGQGAGVLLVLGSVVCASTFSVILKRHAGASNTFANTAVFFPTTAAGLWVLSVTLERQPVPLPLPFEATAALLYLAIPGSVVTFGAYFYLVRHVRLATVTTLVLLEPVVALFVDALFEHRAAASAFTYAGAAITLSGVLATIVFGERERGAADGAATG